MRRLAKRLAWVGAGGLGAYGVVALWVAVAAVARTPHPYLESSGPWNMAHRGGATLWPENTSLAFENCVALGVDVLELDVHATRDGELVVIHDARVDRTTDGEGRVVDYTLDELRELDAAYRFQDASGHYPHRGTGVRVPRLAELFERFPDSRFNIEMKADSLAQSLLRVPLSIGRALSPRLIKLARIVCASGRATALLRQSTFQARNWPVMRRLTANTTCAQMVHGLRHQKSLLVQLSLPARPSMTFG
ncbi:MAG: glycerophosphodiester phosphodiesterase family protein, partial [Myxococcota bacterium]